MLQEKIPCISRPGHELFFGVSVINKNNPQRHSQQEKGPQAAGQAHLRALHPLPLRTMEAKPPPWHCRPFLGRKKQLDPLACPGERPLFFRVQSFSGQRGSYSHEVWPIFGESALIPSDWRRRKCMGIVT